MKTPKKISSLVFVFCILQWPPMPVDSATAASSSQLSFGKSNSDQAKDASSTGLLGAIYHKSRQSRCVTCYEDRYEDRSRYHGGGYSSRSGDDRSGNWYYPRNDRYEDRTRGGDYDRYGGMDRYGGGGADRYGAGGADRYGSGGADRYGSGGYRDDRYDTRSAYDRYDTRGYGDRRGSYDRGESRGYGYDNRDRYYGGERGGEYSPRDRYYDRPRYGSSGGAAGYGYDRDYYDRYSPRYDFRSYRPSWDGAYSKGQSGYDNSGRGYYTNKAGKEDRRYLPEPAYRYPGSGSPCGIQKPNCPYGPQDGGGTRVTSGPIDSGNHNLGVSHSIYNPGANHNDSTKGSGAGWSYMREDDSDRQPPRDSSGGGGGGGGSSGTGGGNSSSASSRDRNREQQSPAYGALLDRGSNLIAVEPAATSEDGQENSDKSPSSSASSSSATVDDNGQQNANGQNS